MFIRTIILIFLLTSALQATAQNKTYAFFMVGNYSYKEWEKIEFDVSGDYGQIRYSYAAKPTGIVLNILGTKYVNNIKVLMVEIPGFKKVFYLNPDPKKNRIQLVSSDNKYNKWFPLGYEGPINGIGTHCVPCANEPKDAFEIVGQFITNY